MPARNLLDWISLNLLPGLGPVRLRRALERFGEPGEIAYRVPLSDLVALAGLRGERADELAGARRTLRERAERELGEAERLGLRILVATDEDYPAALTEVHDAPILLYLRGSLPPGVTRVAVVGSRRATLYGERVAAGMGAGLAAHGIEIVSGGARGIDTAAHKGALSVGGRSVAVLGSGFLHPYPEQNAELFDEIAASGALVSEFPLELAPLPENFPRRNRVISGLCAAVVVVEAARNSGSLITAGHALEQGREVLAVPGPVSSDRSTGTNWLIQQGARLVQNVEDVLEELSPMFRASLSRPEPRSDEGQAQVLPGLLPDEQTVLDMLDPLEPQQLDELAERAPFGFARLQTALFALEMRGAIDPLPGRHYRRK